MRTTWQPDVSVRPHRLDDSATLDPERVAAFRDYLEEEYAGPYVEGWGTTEILRMVRDFIPAGRRLDVGSGTAALFWILAADAGIRTTATDVEPEALHVLRDFLSSPRDLPPCYAEAAGLFGRSDEHAQSLRDSIEDYVVFNALKEWPEEFRRGEYDSVTAFGCFAIAGSRTAYQRCFARALPALKPGGRLVGADWIRHPGLQQRDYSFIGVEILRAIGAALGLEVMHLSTVSILDHDTYGEVVLWAFEKH